MAGSVDVGSLEATLKIGDAYSAIFNKFKADAATIADRLKKVEERFSQNDREVKKHKENVDKIEQAYKKTAGAKAQQTENARVEAAYKRVAASLNPVTANAQKYENAQKILESALRKGLITQKEYNDQLGKAKEKYLTAGESAEQYARKVQDLGGKISTAGTNLTKFVSLPLVAIGGLSIKAATDFETSFAGVRKTIDATEEQFAKLSQDLRDMAAGDNPIPIDVNQLNAVAESAGQLGIARDKVIAFTRTMADLGETTNLTATEAAESIAQFQNIFGRAGEEVDRFGSTLVALGNNGASTEKSILSMGVRIAGAGKQIGLTQGQVLAIASALSSVNIEAEAGGSAISKVMIEMALAVSKGGKELNNFASVSRMSANEFKEAFQNDAAGTVTAFIEGLGRLKSEGGNMLLVLDQMGISEIRMRDALLRAAGAGHLLRDSLDLQSKAWSENTALANEAQKRYETFDSQLKIFTNQVKDVAITFGTALLPALKSGLEIAKPWIDWLANAAKGFANLDPFVQTVILGIGALGVAIGPVIFVTGQLIQAWGQILLLAPKVAGAMGTVALATKGLVVAGVLLFINNIITKWGEAQEAVTRYNLEVARIEGNALAFAQQVSRGALDSTIPQGTFDTKIEEAKILGEHIVRIHNEVESLNRTIKEGSGQNAFLAKEKLVGKEQELKNLQGAYNKLRTALAGVTVVGKEAEKTFDPGPFVGLDTSSDKANKAIKRLIDSINDSISSLRLKAEHAERLSRAILNGTKALKSEELAIAKENIVRDLNNSLASEGLSLTKKQIEAIGQYVVRERDATKALNDRTQALERLISQAGNIAERGFDIDFKRFTDSAHRGMELIQIDVEEMVTGLAKIKDLDVEIEFNSRLMDVEPHLRDLEADYLSFLEDIGSGFEQAGENAIDSGERILTTIGTRFGKTIDEVKAKLQQISDMNLAMDFKAQLAIPKDVNEELAILKKTLDRLKNSVDVTGKALLTESEAREIYNRALIQGAKDFAVSVISVVQTLGTLGGATGKWNTALGGLSGIISSGGSDIGSWLQLMVGIAEGFTNKGGVHGAAQFNVASGLASVDGVWSGIKGQLDEMLAAAEEFAGAINLITKELGGGLVSLPQIDIIQKGEGWVVEIENMARRYFEDFQDAVAWGAAEAIKQADLVGVSEEIMTAFRAIVFDSLEEIRDFTAYADEYTSYGLSNLANGLKDLTKWFIDSARKAQEYGLSLAKVSEEFGRRAQTWRDQILGIERSPQEQLKQDVIDFNRWVEEQRLLAQIQIDAASGQMVAAKLQMEAARAMLKGQGMDRDPEMIKLFLEAERLFKEAGLRLDLWTKALENLPPPITPEEEAGARKRGRGGKGGGQKDNVRDWITDKRFELNTRGMEEWARKAAEISRQYDQQLEQAGKDKKIRAELLALKERELALLDQEHMASVQKSYEDFTKRANAFAEVRNIANGLIESIENSPFGNAKKAEMIANVVEEINRQIEELSLSEAASLFSGLIGDMEKFGASESEMSEARKHLAVIEHTLNVVNYRTRFEILKAEGKLSKEILATLDKSIKFVEGVDPLKIIGGGIGRGKPLVSSEWLARQSEMSTAVDKTVSDLEKLREAFIDAKTKIIDEVLAFDRGEFGAIVPEQSWAEAQRQFEAIVSSAKLGNLEAFQDAPEAFKNTLDVLKDFSPALFATLAPQLRDQFKGLADLTTIKQGNLVITDFEKRAQHKETVDTLNRGFSDLSSSVSDQQETSADILEELRTLNRQQNELNSRLALLESRR